MPCTPLTRSIAAAFVSIALFSACATTQPPAAPPTPEPGTPTPQPEAVAPAVPALEPSEAALRAADAIELTGRELGTMWTFENPPLAYWAERYDFRATPEWLEHVRLSSVRYGQSCSASFVSPDGLVMTNHHCARECVEAVSDAQNDYVEQGFYAASRDTERLCPDLFLDQLVGIEEVTQRVRGAAPAGATAAEVAEAQAQMAERIEQECQQSTGDTCQVVSLYQGGQYQLYRYERYSPVKLVFAPELQAGYFGGDPDNFTYPRYALDIAFVRAYQPDGQQPVRSEHHFRWRAEGAADSELVFITGNPGSTSRLITLAQLLYEQQYRHPFLLQLLEGQRALLQSIAAGGPDAEREVRQDLFEIENSLKAYTGQLAGLRDTLLVARKIRWERELRDQVGARPELQREYGDLWDDLAQIQARKFVVSPRLNVANKQFLGAPHLVFAGQLVDYLREMALPEAERSEDFRGTADQIEAMLRSQAQVDPEISLSLLRLHLQAARRWLAGDDPLLGRLLEPDETPDQAARRLTAASRVLDAAFREQLLAGGWTALEAETDPFIRFALEAEPLYRRLNEEWQELIAAEQLQNARLAEVLFAVHGTALPPDATFTLRISDGVVQRYPYNGTVAPPHTTFYGLYGRSAAFNGEMPWTLPESFADRRDRVRMATPLNTVSTNDITGGNSGSPLIDREARIVGIAFDGNIEQLPNEFVFRTESARSIHVHVSGILEALRNVYGATALVTELLGSTEASSR